MTSSKNARLLTAIAIPLVSLVVIVVMWDLSVRVFDIAPYVLPSPERTLAALQDDWETLSAGAVITSKEFITGFLIGAVAGFLFALAMSWSRLIQGLGVRGCLGNASFEREVFLKEEFKLVNCLEACCRTLSCLT